jgi:hypothetical protein
MDMAIISIKELSEMFSVIAFIARKPKDPP